jgi:hypothetical protein
MYPRRVACCLVRCEMRRYRLDHGRIEGLSFESLHSIGHLVHAQSILTCLFECGHNCIAQVRVSREHEDMERGGARGIGRHRFRRNLCIAYLIAAPRSVVSKTRGPVRSNLQA